MKQSADKTQTTALTPELSYYKVKLINFMASAHPHFVIENQFSAESWEEWLSVRSDAAELEDERCVREGMPQHLAEQYATSVLLSGLRFSPHLTIQDILFTTYPTLFQQFTPEVVHSVERACASIFEKYDLGDDYASDPLYDECLRDLKVHIHQFLFNTYK